MASSLKTLFEVVGNAAAVAGLIAAITAMVAATIAYLKYRSDRDAQRFSNAVHLYRRYLELAFQHPRLAEPDEYGIDEAKGEEFSQYEWFLGILLRACEELLEQGGRDKAKWEYTIISQLGFHCRYLDNNKWFKQVGIKNYSEDLQKLMRECIVRSKYNSSALP